MLVICRVAIKPRKTWNLRNFENNLEFCTKIMEKPGILLI